MNRYQRILEHAVSEPWAILPEKLAVIQELMAFRVSGGRLTDDEINERLAAANSYRTGRMVTESVGRVAVLPLVGTIVPRGNMYSESSGAVSVQRFTSQLREAMNDPEITHVVIDVDSPGGQVSGVTELTAEIYNARETKPITAVANTLAASAAYSIASAAGELVVTPSGEVGSIGVFTMHEDWSEYMKSEGISVEYISAGEFKVEGNPYEPLGDVARAAIQSRIDEYYNIFVTDVARNRGVSAEQVTEFYGRGRTLRAEAARTVGMVDRIATLDEVIAGILKRGGNDGEKQRRRLRNAQLKNIWPTP